MDSQFGTMKDIYPIYLSLSTKCHSPQTISGEDLPTHVHGPLRHPISAFVP